jgi:hypothetical protein
MTLNEFDFTALASSDDVLTLTVSAADAVVEFTTPTMVSCRVSPALMEDCVLKPIVPVTVVPEPLRLPTTSPLFTSVITSVQPLKHETGDVLKPAGKVTVIVLPTVEARLPVDEVVNSTL